MGGGIGSLLGSLFGGGGQQVPQTTAGAPPAPAAAPAAGTPGAPDPMAGGLGGFQMPQMGQLPPMPQPGILDSPALQGLLGAYFGAIGSPRSMGLGGAISRGGLGGLAAYQQAKQEQYKPYLMGLQMADAQARLAGTQLGMQKTQLELHNMAGEQESNRQTAASVRMMAQQTQDPQLQQELLTRAQAIESSPHWYDPSHLFDDLDKKDREQLQTQLTQMHIADEQFKQTHLQPLEEQRLQAGIVGEQAGITEKGLSIEQKRQELGLAPATGKAALTQTKETEQLRTEIGKEFDAQPFSAISRYAGALGLSQGDAREQYINQQLANRGIQQPTSGRQIAPGVFSGAAPAGVQPTAKRMQGQGGQVFRQYSDGQWYPEAAG